MNISEIIKSSINYPRQNWISVIILGIVLAIASLPISLGLTNSTGLYVMIINIIAIFASFVASGYSLDVIKYALNREDIVPAFSFINQFTNGFKLLLISIVYMIIPTIIVFILIGITVPDTNITNTTDLISMGTPSISVLVIGSILFIIFGLFLAIAQCRLAKTDSMSEALKFKAVFNDLTNVGVLNLIGLIILVFFIVIICAIILGLAGAILSLFGIVGVIIYLIIMELIFIPYFTIFADRCIGLLYSNIVSY